MKLSTKMRYGTRAMLELALHYDEGLVNAKDIAERQQVSPKYLEHLLAALRTAGLVRSARGAQGGHMLARPPAQINLRAIFDALEDTSGLVECTVRPDLCDRIDDCVTHQIWCEMYTACLSILESTTLGDLAQRARAKQRRPVMSYEI